MIDILDTTLRDGAQTYGVSFSIQDKLSMTQRLDELGIKYIEGGWPGSNPKDVEYFKAVKDLRLKHSEVVAFGSTRRKDTRVEDDRVLNILLETDVKTAVIFGKAWTLHVSHVLRTSLEENLNMIRDSVKYLRGHGLSVVFDAEHFFDGYKENRDYAIQVVKMAEEAGAHTIVLCDTNGGTLIHELQKIVETVRGEVKANLGIHTHNDVGLAVANTLAAVLVGAKHIQGTINGLGERCGNADLIQVLPTLQFKMGFQTLISDDPLEGQMKKLKSLSEYLYQLLNLQPDHLQPYVGRNAFAHKGGIHIDAILKYPKAYEHIDPSLVGNKRNLVISELSGRSAIIEEIRGLGLNLDKDMDAAERITRSIKELEAQGHHFENAKATVHLIIFEILGRKYQPFHISFWQCTSSKNVSCRASAEVEVVVDGVNYHEVAKGVGPVHALDLALRKALSKRFPQLQSVDLINYKVTVVESVKGTASLVRVFIEFKEGDNIWATTWVSGNILEASIQALYDGYRYRLMLDKLNIGY